MVERGGPPCRGSGDARQRCGKNEDARQVRKEHRGQRLKSITLGLNDLRHMVNVIEIVEGREGFGGLLPGGINITLLCDGSIQSRKEILTVLRSGCQWVLARASWLRALAEFESWPHHFLLVSPGDIRSPSRPLFAHLLNRDNSNSCFSITHSKAWKALRTMPWS